MGKLSCLHINDKTKPWKSITRAQDATLKERFDIWPCKVLELFSSLLKPEVTDEVEQIPLEALEMDLQI